MVPGTWDWEDTPCLINLPQLLNRSNLRALQGFLPSIQQVSFFGRNSLQNQRSVLPRHVGPLLTPAKRLKIPRLSYPAQGYVKNERREEKRAAEKEGKSRFLGYARNDSLEEGKEEGKEEGRLMPMKMGPDFLTARAPLTGDTALDASARLQQGPPQSLKHASIISCE